MAAERTWWRLVARRHAERAFTGDGARAHGGRWNSKGVRVVYVAESRALALLEVLVHLESTAALAGFVRFGVAVPEGAIEVLDAAALPADWRRAPAPAATRAIGDEWAAAGRSLALRVPSALVPEEHGLLLNPAHADFARLAPGAAEPVDLDRRLAR